MTNLHDGTINVYMANRKPPPNHLTLWKSSQHLQIIKNIHCKLNSWYHYHNKQQVADIWVNTQYWVQTDKINAIPHLQIMLINLSHKY